MTARPNSEPFEIWGHRFKVRPDRRVMFFLAIFTAQAR